jgi:predicted ATP-dependent endonuclease of OLD family
MQLKRVHFDAFKSLLGKSLEIADSCIGLVGINESGKSNVLQAIAAISRENPLTVGDTPKMRKTNPRLRFEFTLDERELTELGTSISHWSGRAEGLTSVINTPNFKVFYCVEFDRKTRQEHRSFALEGVELPQGILVRKSDAVVDGYVVRRGENMVPLSEVVLATEDELEADHERRRQSTELSALREKIALIENEIAESEAKTASQADSDAGPSESTQAEGAADEPQAQEVDEAAGQKPKATAPSLTKKRKELTRLIENRDEILSRLGGFDVEERIAQAIEQKDASEKASADHRSSIATAEAKLKELTEDTKSDEAQTKEVAAHKKSLTALKLKLERSMANASTAERTIRALSETLRDKFTADASALAAQLSAEIDEDWLPKVVFWAYSDSFVLKGEYELANLVSAQSLDEIPRPLLNLFRIGLDVTTLEGLRETIREAQEDASERSRFQDRLNKRITEYLKNVWGEYDQEIRVALEKDRMRIQFLDPKCENAAYFEMQERSQGCRTFVSFLLTVGAEAKRGFIRDTVLLLDEPETHLHPTGVRYMLHELIRAANYGNKVVFSTHSIFMIDRDNFNRHVILKKQREQTTIQLSTQERVGFFMQEEVLYDALNIDLDKDFNSTRRNNFVFEGDGDALMFGHFYDEALDRDSQPYERKVTGFFHGGGCSAIEKYVKARPIQLGTKWIFALDADKPAQELKAFIQERYSEFIDSHIFIIQYATTGGASDPVELEDLLPEELVDDVVRSLVDEAISATADAALKKGGLFAERFSRVTAMTDDADDFKARFKAALNQRLRSELAGLRTPVDFKARFPVYSGWATSVASRLKDAQTASRAARQGDGSPGALAATDKRASRGKT